MFSMKNLQIFRFITKHAHRFVYPLNAISLVIVFFSAVHFFKLNNSDAISLINSLSSIVIVIIALHEIKGWKQRIIIERKIKASEDFTLLFYKCYDAIRKATSPFTPMPNIIKIGNEECISDICEFKINVINSYDDLFSEMKARSHEFRIILGEKHSDICMKIITIISSLKLHINEYQRNSAESIRLRNEAAMHEQSSVDGEMLRDKCLQSAKQFEENAKKFEPVIWGRDSSCVTKQLEKLEKEVQSMQAQYIQY